LVLGLCLFYRLYDIWSKYICSVQSAE
jgi:hypothetical protein